jgi:hypothetical protein
MVGRRLEAGEGYLIYSGPGIVKSLPGFVYLAAGMPRGIKSIRQTQRSDCAPETFLYSAKVRWKKSLFKI